MQMSFKYFTTIVFFILISINAQPENESYCDDFSSTGLYFDVNAKEIISVSNAFISGKTKIDARNASIVAEESAKNQVIRWISQDQYTEIEIIDVITTSESTTETIDEYGNIKTSTQVNEKLIQTFNEFSRSTSNETLKRVKKIAERYNINNTEVCVAISVSADLKDRGLN
tara:strand:+ start:104 stop:616 length:513 start_codon:yes stop_codon:yes gene_type:complete